MCLLKIDHLYRNTLYIYISYLLYGFYLEINTSFKIHLRNIVIQIVLYFLKLFFSFSYRKMNLLKLYKCKLLQSIAIKLCVRVNLTDYIIIRDLMLAGTQQSVELKLALDQEQLKSKKLEESMRKLDEEMKRTDELLYQMIPKQVADRLRNGESPIDTCEV